MVNGTHGSTSGLTEKGVTGLDEYSVSKRSRGKI